jgi:hypothetical protein
LPFPAPDVIDEIRGAAGAEYGTAVTATLGAESPVSFLEITRIEYVVSATSPVIVNVEDIPTTGTNVPPFSEYEYCDNVPPFIDPFTTVTVAPDFPGTAVIVGAAGTSMPITDTVVLTELPAAFVSYTDNEYVCPAVSCVNVTVPGETIVTGDRP